jgi:ATPase subunit of ABC transporter with duplicated ATPase domains
VDKGERVGILGKNGAGKTTLFAFSPAPWTTSRRGLRGEGTPRGTYLQIHVYPALYTVEDVLRTAFDRVREMTRRWNA